MSYGAAFKATARGAALFAVVYFAATALIDLWLIGRVMWGQQVLSTIIVVPCYWAVTAWLAKRKSE
ncbi:hypothetical protein [Pseudooceanicola sp.]|uniref:hypothetical protein n=1 Tax=Pseudooceanicola sp. TaxID=1914328 RepID=UPI0035C75B87